jgi:hypothetical protein
MHPKQPSFGSPENIPPQEGDLEGADFVVSQSKYGENVIAIKKITPYNSVTPGSKEVVLDRPKNRNVISRLVTAGRKIEEQAIQDGYIPRETVRLNGSRNTTSAIGKTWKKSIIEAAQEKEMTAGAVAQKPTNPIDRSDVHEKLVKEAAENGDIDREAAKAYHRDYADTVPTGSFEDTVNTSEPITRAIRFEPGEVKEKSVLKGKFAVAFNKLRKKFFGSNEQKSEDTKERKEGNFSFLTPQESIESTFDENAVFSVEDEIAAEKEIQGILAKRAASLEQKKNWERKLAKIKKIKENTNNIFKDTLEKVGPSGKKLVSLLSSGSEYINAQVKNPAVKYFASAGLLSAGALAAYATPVVLASMAGVGLGLRVVSAAKIYTSARKILDKTYEKKEKEGNKISAIKMAGLEVGALGVALFSGEIIGKVFEGIASLDVVHEIGTSIKNSANIESITEVWGKLFGGDTPVSIPADVQPVVHTPPVPSPSPVDVSVQNMPAVSAPIEHIVAPDPSLIHHVAKGDSLWSLLRGDLTRLNYEGFNSLAQGDQEKIIQELVNKIEVPSGNKQIIRIGQDVLDFNKYLGK